MPDPAFEQSLFLRALELPTPAERAAYLDDACRDNPGLRAELDALLAAHDRLGGGLPRTTGQEPAGLGPGAGGEEVGAVLSGRYKLVELLGEGGMGAVWMAQQTEPVRRLVAVKVVKAGMDSKQVLARFEAERQALALMDHPNIARVLDAGTTAAGRPYFVMELVKGVPLTRYCDERRLTPRQRLELFVPLCHAIQHAHQKGVIHRDLKPSNVLVALYDGKPVPKVIDFGIAKAAGQPLTDRTLVTGFGSVVGTLEYMSPEQAELNQLDIDTRSDVYSLGVLLYELLTGSTPLEKKRLKEAALLEVLRVIREEEPPRPSARLSTTDELPAVAANRGLEPKRLSGVVRGELDWIVMKALEKDRNRRYETANGFGLDIQRYLADEAVLACPPSAAYRLRKFGQRNKGKLAIAAAVFLALTVMAASVGLAVHDRLEREAQGKRAETARLAQVAGQVRESWQATRTLLGENKVAAARQRLVEAKARLATNRSALADLAAEVEAGAAELDRLQRFLDLTERAHEAEMAPVLETAVAADGFHGGAARPAPVATAGRRPAAAVPFLLEALACYQILERADWSTALEGGLLGRDQVAHLRRTAYEELLWLSDDIMVRQQDHRSGNKLAPGAAAQRALSYLQRADTAHPPTRALWVLRAACHKALGEAAAAETCRQRSEKTRPTLALDHYLLGQAAYDAGRLADALQAFEAAQLLEPTHYWSFMKVGYCLNDLGHGRDDFAAAARIFTGCILKRPDHAHAYWCRGNSYGKLEQHAKAIADFSRAIELDPKLSDAWVRRGIRYRSLGQYDKAVADHSRAIELDPNHALPWSNRGTTFAALGQYDKAIADFSKAIELDPKHAYAWNGRGIVYCDHLGEPEKAVADFSRAIELEPKNAKGWCNRGTAYRKMGHYDKAIANYSRAIELDPRNAKAWNNRGNAYGDMDHYDKAIANYSRAIELDRDYAEFWYNRGLAYLHLAQYDRAVADFSRAIELDPKNAEAWNNRGAAYGKMDHYDKAIADFSRAIELAPKLTQAWHNRGDAYAHIGQHQAAIAEFSRAIELDPKDAKAWHGRGIVYCDHLGEPEKAIADFSRAIELDPKNAKAWNNRGNAYRKMGHHDKAIANYSRALELDPKYAKAWFNRGFTYEKLGQYEQAVADYSKALELDPKDAKAWGHRGTVYCDDLRQPGKAVADFSRVIELDSKNVRGWFNRGIAYQKLGQYEQAVADFSKALELDPKDAKAWLGRGMVYCDDLRQPGKAVADFSRAIELDSKNVRNWFSRGIAYGKLGRYDRSAADFSRVLELDAKVAKAWIYRGLSYQNLGRYDQAVADYSKALELDPKNADAHYNLGNALLAKGRPGEAVAAYREAIRLKKDDAEIRFGLGNALRENGLLDEAAAEFRAAIRRQQDYAEAHCNLGDVLRRQGRFRQALDALRRGDELGRAQGPRWRWPSDQWVRQVERLVELDGQLPGFLAGTATPAGRAEQIELAGLCTLKKQYATAARFYADAFAAEPKLADDRNAGHRYNAACAAVLAGCGTGRDADKPDEKKKAQLRGEALAWLQADLAAWTKEMAKNTREADAAVRAKMRHWQTDPDLAGVRGAAALAKLPEAERQPWQKLWDDAAEILGRAQEKDSPKKSSPAR